jgi:hypothetical protein
MKQFTHKVLTGAAPVIATTLSIAIVQAAHLPFPAALSMEALPQWLLLCSIVYCSTALILFTVNRLLGEPQAATAGASVPTD